MDLWQVSVGHQHGQLKGMPQTASVLQCRGGDNSSSLILFNYLKDHKGQRYWAEMGIRAVSSRFSHVPKTVPKRKCRGFLKDGKT